MCSQPHSEVLAARNWDVGFIEMAVLGGPRVRVEALSSCHLPYLHQVPTPGVSTLWSKGQVQPSIGFCTIREVRVIFIFLNG